MSGPGISAVEATCSSAPTAVFGCKVPIPAGVMTGTARYALTAVENPGLSGGFVKAPAVGTAVNPVSVQFR